MSDDPQARLRLPILRTRSRRSAPTRRARRHGAGQSVVEFALVVPIFLLLLLMAVDFGRLFYSYVQISNAAREAAAFGATAPTDTAGMQSRAVQEKNSQSQGEPPLDPITTRCANPAGATITCASAPGGTGAGNTLTVAVHQPFDFITPLIDDFFGNDLRVSASATTAVLGTAATGGGVGPGACGGPTVATFTTFSSGLTVTVDPAGSLPDTGVCTISGYNWDFGDGNTTVGSTIPSTHTYGAPGTYLITLEVTNQGGVLSASQTVTVPAAAPTPTPTPDPSPGPTPTPGPTATPTPAPTPCAAPAPNFTWTAGNPRRNVTFQDLSTASAACPITNWLWSFGDNTPNSNAPNPSHAFPSNNGSWQVTLTVTNSAGSQSITRTVSL
jgi:Flp pilus assembly protein TadG